MVYQPLNFELGRFGSTLLEVSVLLLVHRGSVDSREGIELEYFSGLRGGWRSLPLILDDLNPPLSGRGHGYAQR